MGLRGNVRTLRDLRSQLRKIPRTVAVQIAEKVAPAITDETRTAYDGGRSVYGEVRPRSVETGAPLTLVRSGRVRSEAQFKSYGTQVWCVLGPPYAKFLIGKYGILPNGPLPAGWSLRIKSESDQVIRAQLPALVKGGP